MIVAFGILFRGCAISASSFTVRTRSERTSVTRFGAALRGAAQRGRCAPGAGGRRTMVGFCFGLCQRRRPRHSRARRDSRVRHDRRVRHTLRCYGLLNRLWSARSSRNGWALSRRRGRPIPGPGTACRGRGNHHRLLAAEMPCWSRMRFDFDPMYLQDRNGEAVSTYRELITVTELGIRSVNIVAPSVAPGRPDHQRTSRLPSSGTAVDQQPGAGATGPEAPCSEGGTTLGGRLLFGTRRSI